MVASWQVLEAIKVILKKGGAIEEQIALYRWRERNSRNYKCWIGETEGGCFLKGFSLSRKWIKNFNKEG